MYWSVTSVSYEVLSSYRSKLDFSFQHLQLGLSEKFVCGPVHVCADNIITWTSRGWPGVWRWPSAFRPHTCRTMRTPPSFRTATIASLLPTWCGATSTNSSRSRSYRLNQTPSTTDWHNDWLPTSTTATTTSTRTKTTRRKVSIGRDCPKSNRSTSGRQMRKTLDGSGWWGCSDAAAGVRAVPAAPAQASDQTASLPVSTHQSTKYNSSSSRAGGNTSGPTTNCRSSTSSIHWRLLLPPASTDRLSTMETEAAALGGRRPSSNRSLHWRQVNSTCRQRIISNSQNV